MPTTRATTNLPGGIESYLLENQESSMTSLDRGPSTEDLIRMASARLGIEVEDEVVPERPEE